MMKKLILIPLLSLTLVACSGENEGVGTALGAIIGGLVGSEVSGGDTEGVIIGAAIGGMVGNTVGRKLDERDRQRMAYALQEAMENQRSGSTQEWYNPDSGNRGTFVPQPAYQTDSGQYCREYQQTVTIGGDSEQMYGTACRQPDGSWKVSKLN